MTDKTYVVILKVGVGTPHEVRIEETERPPEKLNAEHQIAVFKEVLNSGMVGEITFRPLIRTDADNLIEELLIEKEQLGEITVKRGGKRSKRKRPKRKSKKLKYFFLKKK